MVGITQSGETADTLAAMRLARARGASVLAITNVMGSQATREADAVLFTRAGAADRFAMVFAICASFIAVASLLNARLVMRLGMRRLSHSALLAYIAVAALHLLAAGTGHETLVVFAALQAAAMFTFGLTSGNFGAMAMEPMGHIAGVASAFQGCVSMVGASLIGFVIGQCFNGTVAPMEAGYLLCGLCALASVLVAESGRLFRPHAIGALVAP